MHVWFFFPMNFCNYHLRSYQSACQEKNRKILDKMNWKHLLSHAVWWTMESCLEKEEEKPFLSPHKWEWVGLMHVGLDKVEDRMNEMEGRETAVWNWDIRGRIVPTKTMRVHNCYCTETSPGSGSKTERYIGVKEQGCLSEHDKHFLHKKKLPKRTLWLWKNICSGRDFPTRSCFDKTAFERKENGPKIIEKKVQYMVSEQ